eukprot:CAMPEP_0170900686 /NCGR_PEP_ID=MMETSP0734-20130129/47744_1 /TAXON_ID=186038 /ORGANISM="Fragilariopsis kerguelensis, Strain L26-C5" /LENGTH=524 /DNA_ID=CAMNT_0011294579 /DNA_START=109 /DNA_END=1683 /DNA_ORIENTATION=-
MAEREKRKKGFNDYFKIALTRAFMISDLQALDPDYIGYGFDPDIVNPTVVGVKEVMKWPEFKRVCYDILKTHPLFINAGILQMKGEMETGETPILSQPMLILNIQRMAREYRELNPKPSDEEIAAAAGNTEQEIQQRLRLEIVALQDTYDRLVTEHNRVRTERDQLQGRIGRLETIIENVNGKLTEAEAKVDRIETQSENKITELEDKHKKEKTKLKTKYDTKKDEHKHLTSVLNTKIADLEKLIKPEDVVAQAELLALKRMIEVGNDAGVLKYISDNKRLIVEEIVSQEEYDRMEADHERWETETASLKEQLSVEKGEHLATKEVSEGKILVLQEENEYQNYQIGVVESQLSAEKKNHGATQKKVQALETKITKGFTLVKDLRGDIATEKAKNLLLKMDQTQEEGRVADLEQQITAANAVLADQEEELAVVKREMAAEKERVADLEQQLTDANAVLAVQVEELAATKRELAATKKELADEKESRRLSSERHGSREADLGRQLAFAEEAHRSSKSTDDTRRQTF